MLTVARPLMAKTVPTVAPELVCRSTDTLPGRGLPAKLTTTSAELEVEHAAAGRNETRSRFVECWSMYSQSACALASGALNQNLISVSGNSSNLPGSTAISNHTRVPGLHGVGLHALEPFALDHGDS